MTDVAIRLKNELLLLSEKDRAELVHILLQSLDDVSDGDVEAAWEAELKRRSDEIHSGDATGRPADEVFQELRKTYS